MIATLVAQAQSQPAQGIDTRFLISIVLMIAIFYFLLIRPQQRRVRQQRELVGALQVGDDVVTIGGMHGVIQGITDDEVTLEISPGTRVRFVKQAIARRLVREPLDGEAGGGA